MTLKRGVNALISSVIVGVCAVTVWLVVPMPGRADAPETGCAGDPDSPDLASGEGTIAISNRELVIVGARSRGCSYQQRAVAAGMLRHLAVRRGAGTAYVQDLEGGDVIVVHGSDGVRRIRSASEVTHPALSSDGAVAWAEDMAALRMRTDDSTTRIARPPGTSAIFSPVFVGNRLAAVAQVAQGGATTEDDTLNNLFRRTQRGWIRLTDFKVEGDGWSVIRTPLAVGRDLLFVRIRGHESRTGEPRFELWRIHEGAAAKLRDLPGEMYLAGLRGGRLMWNVYSPACGDWELLVEADGGRLQHLGCGAVMVDPVNLADPDLEVERTYATSPATTSRTVVPGIVIGDLTSRARAEAVASKVPGSRVITNADAPAAVRPGVFAVALEAGSDVGATLRRVKGLVPRLRDMVFLAPLGKLGG